MGKEKDVARVKVGRGRATKNPKPATKMLPGHVERRRVRCGKMNCRCARGEPHTAHYHVWRAGGVRFRSYISARIVEDVRQACNDYRALQARLRAGRAEYQATLRRARALFRILPL